MKYCHIRDACALIHFFCELDQYCDDTSSQNTPTKDNNDKSLLSEIDIEKKLNYYRSMYSNSNMISDENIDFFKSYNQRNKNEEKEHIPNLYIMPSFGAIVGMGKNGAIIHRRYALWQFWCMFIFVMYDLL
jgi:hypothetical protein